VLKDCTFDRVLAYTNTQLLDFLTTPYIFEKYTFTHEQYLERRLLDFANCQYTKGLLE